MDVLCSVTQHAGAELKKCVMQPMDGRPWSLCWFVLSWCISNHGEWAKLWDKWYFLIPSLLAYLLDHITGAILHYYYSTVGSVRSLRGKAVLELCCTWQVSLVKGKNSCCLQYLLFLRALSTMLSTWNLTRLDPQVIWLQAKEKFSYLSVVIIKRWVKPPQRCLCLFPGLTCF